jgi:N-acetylglutamate synthase-like GNAT family acetyltransferase
MNLLYTIIYISSRLLYKKRHFFFFGGFFAVQKVRKGAKKVASVPLFILRLSECDLKRQLRISTDHRDPYNISDFVFIEDFKHFVHGCYAFPVQMRDDIAGLKKVVGCAVAVHDLNKNAGCLRNIGIAALGVASALLNTPSLDAHLWAYPND